MGHDNDLLNVVTHTHSNLNVFAGVRGLLECGVVCNDVGSDKAATTIIRLCEAEIQRLLRLYDKATVRLDKRRRIQR